MKENRINATIAITFFVAAVVMLGALSFAIGKWSWGTKQYTLTVYFPTATGISANSSVKFAGATVGRVKEVKLIPRKEQTQDPETLLYNYVAVVVAIDQNVELGVDSQATIKQDGIGIAAKYVLFMPGDDHNSKLLADGGTLQGKRPFDLTDLVQPAGEALQQAKVLVDQLRPMLSRFDKLGQQLNESLPPLLANGNTFLKNGNTLVLTGNSVLSNLNTPENRHDLNDMLANLRVSTENLKVVSSNAKALTATLADKPWRVFWGGKTVPAPSETDVLKSDKVILLKPEVEVTSGSAAPKKP